MKILYGVQGTGNGHTSRARAMARAFADSSLHVDYLFSGRPPGQYFDMQPFGNFRSRQGMTLFTHNGRMRYLKTILGNRPVQLVRDVRNLDLSGYDLVISDFEPVSAWAAKLRGVPSLGLAHQYAFFHPVPTAGRSLGSRLLMQWFAPADISLGLHWHHFGAPILPPLIEQPRAQVTTTAGKVLVYLPFENHRQVCNWLTNDTSHDYYVYSDTEAPLDIGNLHLRPYSRDRFVQDFLTAEGVIANAGFMLSSEAIHYGKKLLVKPVHGQIEQESNAAALIKLNFGCVTRSLDPAILQRWLITGTGRAHPFPDTASHIVAWIEQGMERSLEQLARDVWQGDGGGSTEVLRAPGDALSHT